jgi:acyl carrier protein
MALLRGQKRRSLKAMIERTAALNIVYASIQEVFAQTGVDAPSALTEDTVLVGKDAVLDSLGVVSLIVEVEQRVEGEHGASVTLANDKAMSQRNSPFRTVGILTDHVVAMVAEVSAA